MKEAGAEPASRSSNTLASTCVVGQFTIRESLCRHLDSQVFTRFKAALISTFLSTME